MAAGEQCHKLEEAGLDYWMTFLNGVVGREHSQDHAVNSAKVFSQCHPMLVGTGGLTLFPGTPLLEESQRGECAPLSEKEMLIELKAFVENLTCDCSFITHHTVAANLTGPNFLIGKVKSLPRWTGKSSTEIWMLLRRYGGTREGYRE